MWILGLVLILFCFGLLQVFSQSPIAHLLTAFSAAAPAKNPEHAGVIFSGGKVLDNVTLSLTRAGENAVLSLIKEDQNTFLENTYVFQATGAGGYITLADDKGGIQRIRLTELEKSGNTVNKAPASVKHYRGKVEDILLDKNLLAREDYLKDEKLPVIISLKADGGQRGRDFSMAESQVSSLLSEDSSKDLKIKSLPLINAISAEVPAEKLPELERSPLVERISLDRRVYVLLDESVPLINATQLRQTKDLIGRNITGVNTTIAVIDTGVDYTHPDLGSCTTSDFLNGSCSKVVGGYDFANKDNDPIDDHGHGTHCAGIAAGDGVLTGVAPNAKILAVKVLSSGGSGSTSDVIAGIQYAVDPNQDGDYGDHVDVISMSLGGGGNPDDELSHAVDTAVVNGVVVVVAAGNSGSNAETINSPGCARSALTVGAMCKPNQVGNESYCSNLIASFSSRGPTSIGGIKPDVVAPGVKICSARWDDYEDGSECFDEEHIRISGTSMATPHVAGAAALLKQAHPEWLPLEVKSALMATASDLGFGVNTQGTGKIDVFKASNAHVATTPQSVSFGYVNSSFFSDEITIKNLGSDLVTLNLSVSSVTDDKGANYSFASVNASSLTVAGNSQGVILLAVNSSSDAEGIFEGKVTIVDESNLEYKIPFSFTKLSTLTVRLDGGDKPLYPNFYLHDSNLSIDRSASQGDDVEGNTTTFRLPGGNYTVYALGDMVDYSTEYILMDSVEVPVWSQTNLTLRLGDARPFTVKARSLDGRNLKLYEWQKGFSSYKNQRVYGVNYFDPTVGDRTVYVSNKPNNSFNTDVVFKYYGTPVET